MYWPTSKYRYFFNIINQSMSSKGKRCGDLNSRHCLSSQPLRHWAVLYLHCPASVLNFKEATTDHVKRGRKVGNCIEPHIETNRLYFTHVGTTVGAGQYYNYSVLRGSTTVLHVLTKLQIVSDQCCGQDRIADCRKSKRLNELSICTQRSSAQKRVYNSWLEIVYTHSFIQISNTQWDSFEVGQ